VIAGTVPTFQCRVAANRRAGDARISMPQLRHPLRPCAYCRGRLVLRTIPRPEYGAGCAEWRARCPTCDVDFEREPDDGPAAA
jgi:hypothetical protein